MAQVVMQLKGDLDCLICYSGNGRSFVEALYSRQRLPVRLEELLQNVIEL